MSDVPVSISPEAVNQYIAKAILDSAIGEQLQKCIEERLTDFRLGAAIERAVDAAISQIVFQLLSSEHGDELREAVKSKISGDIVADLAGKALDNWLESR